MLLYTPYLLYEGSKMHFGRALARESIQACAAMFMNSRNLDLPLQHICCRARKPRDFCLMRRHLGLLAASSAPLQLRATFLDCVHLARLARPRLVHTAGGAHGIQAPQFGQQHNSQLQKSLAVPPRTGNFDTLLHIVEISDSRETVDQVRKLLKREHARPETGFRPRHCGIHRATHVNTSENK
jgi:hypothetical protein